jgi:hypothetical protein
VAFEPQIWQTLELMQTPKNKKRTGDISSRVRKQLVVSDTVANLSFLDNSEK